MFYMDPFEFRDELVEELKDAAKEAAFIYECYKCGEDGFSLKDVDHYDGRLEMAQWDFVRFDLAFSSYILAMEG